MNRETRRHAPSKRKSSSAQGREQRNRTPDNMWSGGHEQQSQIKERKTLPRAMFSFVKNMNGAVLLCRSGCYDTPSLPPVPGPLCIGNQTLVLFALHRLLKSSR